MWVVGVCLVGSRQLVGGFDGWADVDVDLRGKEGRENPREKKDRKETPYVENLLRSPSTGIRIFFTQRD